MVFLLEEEWPPFSGTGVLLLKVTRVQSFNGFASSLLRLRYFLLLPPAVLVFVQLHQMFILLFSSKKERELKIEEGAWNRDSHHLSFATKFNLRCAQHFKTVLDFKNVAKHEVLLHILKGENWLSVSDIRRKTILPEMKTLLIISSEEKHRSLPIMLMTFWVI